ncbi:MAG TPA: glycosyltransferase family 2 protein [Candidatus Saccharimonadales bacterium]|nr:glycosyltransferase family 2 protein [Candidatus Saccharimonadales bacterium]
MKVVVQIPCLNEEETLALVLNSIPKHIPQVDSIEVLIIDDGSTDKTIEVAKKHGVKHFVYHPLRKGLARSFHDGVLKALDMGADIIVNTDGDNQYPQERIGDLVRPILEGRADMVIADRQTSKIKHFSPGKKLMQRLGTTVLNLAAGTKIPDAPSGFRAYSRDAAMQLNIVTRFSYAMETIIQAGHKNMSIVSIPIETNPKTRESRLFKSSWEHVRKSGGAIIRAFIMYRPYVFFMTLGGILLLAGIFPFGRYVYYFLQNEGSGHVQSLLLGIVLLVGAFISFALGIIADLIRINRTLIEEGLEQIRHNRFDR